jgi:thioredoxin-dependent peroxiredoxin
LIYNSTLLGKGKIGKWAGQAGGQEQGQMGVWLQTPTPPLWYTATSVYDQYAQAEQAVRLLQAASEQLALHIFKRRTSMTQLKIGDPAPDFTALTDAGTPLKLSDLRGKRVVIYFYPKDDTPGCTTQACGFRDHYLDIQERNALVLGVSPDGVKSHQKFKTKFNLPFTLVADEDHAIAEAYGAWGEKSNYGKEYMGIIRSHLVIDEAGTVVDAQYNVKPEQSVERALGMI